MWLHQSIYETIQVLFDTYDHIHIGENLTLIQYGGFQDGSHVGDMA